jgi:hypothetical protein
MAMGYVSLQNAKLDSLAAASLSVAGTSSSVTLFVNPTDIFVAQIALTQVQTGVGREGVGLPPVINAYISGITLQNGVVIDFPDTPNLIEYAWTESVTFVLEPDEFTSASAVATVSTYNV